MNRNRLIPELRFPEFANEKEWEEKTLDKVVDDFIVPMRDKPKKLDGDIPWCRIEDFNGMYLSVSKSKQGVSLETIKEMNLKVYPVNTLLVSCSADLGRCAITANELITNQTFIGLVPDIKKVNTIYLYYVMTNSRNELNARSSGTTISYLSRQQFEKFEILLPKLKEQQKIASCLSSLDELIATHSQKLDVLKEHKKGLMQNLFPQEGETVPKYRFPEFVGDRNWVEKSFEQLFEIGNGRDYKHLSKGNIPVYGSGGYMLSVNDYLYDGESVCIGRKGTIDKPMFLTGKFWTVDTLFYTHSFNDCVPIFIYYIFQNINWRSHNEAGGVPSLSKTNLYKIEVFIPKPKEQQKIASCLSSIDELITAQGAKIEQLKLHKKGLMQGLFPKVNN